MATLPVLPLTDAVLLPGMVIPVTLDPTTQAADRRGPRRPATSKLLAVPRIDGEYGPVGVVAAIEKVGRLPSGEPAAVIRGLSRARIGSGVPGPGAALWVEATRTRRARPAGRARELAREYKALVTSRAPAARRLAGHRRGRADDRPVRAGRLGRLRAVADPGAEDRAARRAGRDRPAGAAGRLGHGPPGRAGGHREDQQRRPRGAGEDPARVPAAPAARRDPQGARRGRAGRLRRLPDPRRGRRPAGEGPRGGPARGRQAGAGQRRLPGGGLDPHLAGHRAGDAVEHAVPRTTPTWPRPARCSTPTTPAWPT